MTGLLSEKVVSRGTWLLVLMVMVLSFLQNKVPNGCMTKQTVELCEE